MVEFRYLFTSVNRVVDGSDVARNRIKVVRYRRDYIGTFLDIVEFLNDSVEFRVNCIDLSTE